MSSIKKLSFITITALITLIVFVIAPAFFGGRPLTQAERDILEPLYGTSVALDNVRIKSGGILTTVYPGITLGNTISFPTHGYQATDRKNQALLVHEVCHVWQYQHFGLGYIPRSLWELITQRDTYVVHYNPQKAFREYDVEEQCEIMAEYFLTSDERYVEYVKNVGLYK